MVYYFKSAALRPGTSFRGSSNRLTYAPGMPFLGQSALSRFNERAPGVALPTPPGLDNNPGVLFYDHKFIDETVSWPGTRYPDSLI